MVLLRTDLKIVCEQVVSDGSADDKPLIEARCRWQIIVRLVGLNKNNHLVFYQHPLHLTQALFGIKIDSQMPLAGRVPRGRQEISS